MTSASIGNYEGPPPSDFHKILKVFSSKGNRASRLEIMRFLAKEAREEEKAKTYNEIIKHFRETLQETITVQAVRKHCEILKDMGVIKPTRSESHEPSSRGGDYIKFYFVVQKLIEILAILVAGMLGLDWQAAREIKEDLTRVFNSRQRPDQFRYGFYASGLSYLQAPAFDTLRNIAHNYIQLQKDIINSWSAAAEEFSTGYYYYYYPWFYPAASFANMASKAYRSIADYAISGLSISQNNFDASIDISKTYSRLADNNIDEFLRMALNYLKIFKPTARAPIPTEGGAAETTTTTIASIPSLDMGDDEEEYDLSELRKLIDELAEIKEIALSSA